MGQVSPFRSCVTLDKLYKLTQAQFPAWKREVARATGLMRPKLDERCHLSYGICPVLGRSPSTFLLTKPHPVLTIQLGSALAAAYIGEAHGSRSPSSPPPPGSPDTTTPSDKRRDNGHALHVGRKGCLGSHFTSSLATPLSIGREDPSPREARRSQDSSLAA